MGRERFGKPIGSAVAGCVVLLALLLAVAAPSAAAESAGKRVAKHALGPESKVRSYWTPQRMRAARPRHLAAADGAEPTPSSSHTYTRQEIADPSQDPFAAHGKVFLTVRGGSAPGDYVCSGTAVNSGNRSVVWTAGHCVFDDRGGGFASNWIFVPGYRDGAAPHGRWPARTLAATGQWRSSSNLRYDLGAAVVRRDSESRPLAEVVSPRGVAFNQPRNHTYDAFGYPAQPPFSGGRLYLCTSALGGTDSPPGSGPLTSWIGCDMTGGASGGGWVVGGSVLSVTSYSYCTGALIEVCEERLYGPYQGAVAETLYESVRGREHRCAGKRVTHLGTPGEDRIAGTGARDVIKARGGNDEIRARGGNDLICAGPGTDVIFAGRGNDMIRTGGGRNRVFAGPGRDRVFAGPGRNRIVAGKGRNRIRCHRRGNDVVITNKRSRVRGNCARVRRR